MQPPGALAAEGAQVAICGRDRRRIESAAAAIGGDVTPLLGDVSRAEGSLELLEAVETALGGDIGVLVLNGPGRRRGTSTR